MHYTKTFCSS